MSTTTLCFDFGNTRLKCGVFNIDQLSEEFTLENDQNDTINELLEKYKPEATILSSVIDHNPQIEKILAQQSSFVKLDSTARLPFTTPVANPKQLAPTGWRLRLLQYIFIMDKIIS